MAPAVERFLSGGRVAGNAAALRWRTQLVTAGRSLATVELRMAAMRALLRTARVYGLADWALDVRGHHVQALRDTRGPGREAFEAAIRNLMVPDRNLVVPEGTIGHDRVQPRGHICWRATRNVALLHLLHDLALRVSEALGLDYTHVEDDREHVWVLRKCAQTRRLMSLPPETTEALKGWLAHRGYAQGPLFCTRWGGGHRMTPRAVQSLCRKLGLGHPHGLRHLGITEALERTNGDVRKVYRYSGHLDVNNVLRYDDQRRDVAGEVARLVAAFIPPA